MTTLVHTHTCTSTCTPCLVIVSSHNFGLFSVYSHLVVCQRELRYHLTPVSLSLTLLLSHRSELHFPVSDVVWWYCVVICYRYEEQLKEQQSHLEKEDLSDMVAEHAARQKVNCTSCLCYSVHTYVCVCVCVCVWSLSTCCWSVTISHFYLPQHKRKKAADSGKPTKKLKEFKFWNSSLTFQLHVTMYQHCAHHLLPQKNSFLTDTHCKIGSMWQWSCWIRIATFSWELNNCTVLNGVGNAAKPEHHNMIGIKCL